MATITITLTLENENDFAQHEHTQEFEVDTLLRDTIDAWRAELEAEHESVVLSEDVADVDLDHCDMLGPHRFAYDLSEWSEYVEQVDEFGDKFVQRYADIGDYNEDEFEGFYESVDAYAMQWADEMGTVSDEVQCYINWAQYGSELLANHSTYEGYENGRRGIFIFRD